LKTTHSRTIALFVTPFSSIVCKHTKHLTPKHSLHKYSQCTWDWDLSTSCMGLASFTGPCSAFHCLQYGKAGRAWYLFSHEHDVIDKWHNNSE